MHWLVIAVAFGLAYLRIEGDTSLLLQAAAHLFMGGLFVDGCHRKRWCLSWYLVIALSVVETLCFLTSKL